MIYSTALRTGLLFIIFPAKSAVQEIELSPAREANYGILLSVSLLGSSSISTVSISAIISC